MSWGFFNAQGELKEAASHGVSLVAALPSSPVDGDVVDLTDSLTAPTYMWRLRYVAAKSTNKWVFIGGSAGFAEVMTSETQGVTGVYGALTTAGPVFAIPVAGDYEVRIGAAITPNLANEFGTMSYDIGGTGAVDADSIAFGSSTGTTTIVAYGSKVRVKSGLTVVTLTAKYKSTTTVCTYADRSIRVIPVAVGG